MNINYCLPIIKKDKNEVRALIDTQFKKFQYFEVWLDYIEDLNEGFVEELVNLLADRLILLLRRQELAKPVMPEKKQLQIIKNLSGTKSLLDLDIETQSAELSFLKNNNLNINLIGSYHNYQKTPDEVKLRQIVDTIREARPKIIKVTTKCNTERDALDLLKLLLELRKQNQKAIVLGMGPYGAATRVFGTLWGNEMIFAPVKKRDKSAPGQLTQEELENIFKYLS